jgi:recombination protein RecA
VIEKKGSWFYFDDEKIGQGKDITKKHLLENPELFSRIKERALTTNSVQTPID